MRTGPNPAPGPLSQAIAQILLDVIEENSISQTAIAAGAGNISQSHLSKCLRGERVFLVDQLYSVCNVLGLNIGLVVAHASADSKRPT